MYSYHTISPGTNQNPVLLSPPTNMFSAQSSNTTDNAMEVVMAVPVNNLPIPAETTNTTPSRRRGRPVGSKNKVKTEKATTAPAQLAQLQDYVALLEDFTMELLSEKTVSEAQHTQLLLHLAADEDAREHNGEAARPDVSGRFG